MRPEATHLLEPAFEIVEGLALEAIDAETRVVVVTVFAHEAALSKNAEMPAHRGARHVERVGEIARAARLFSQQIDDASSRRIGERE